MLLKFDEDLAAKMKLTRCLRCGGPLHKDRYPRKPRVPETIKLPDAYSWRFSYSCGVCRKRHTPASTRFLGRRIYLGIIVVLATAMQQGPAPRQASRLREELGVSRETLDRWRAWWREAFIKSAFWKVAKAAFTVGADNEMPRSLLEQFRGSALERLSGLLHFVAPVTTPADYIPDQRR